MNEPVHTAIPRIYLGHRSDTVNLGCGLDTALSNVCGPNAERDLPRVTNGFRRTAVEPIRCPLPAVAAGLFHRGTAESRELARGFDVDRLTEDLLSRGCDLGDAESCELLRN